MTRTNLDHIPVRIRLVRVMISPNPAGSRPRARIMEAQMSGKYSADEVFDMAVQLERNGSAFYRKAAGSARSAGLKKMFLGLAAMEEEHEKAFLKLREETAAKSGKDDWFDPDGEASKYMRALAEGQVFGSAGDAEALVAGAGTPRAVLERAVVLEKDSIMFYLGLRRATPPELGRERIDRIIEEEMAHVVLLKAEIQKIK